MLQTLRYWRNQSTPEQLESFEKHLRIPCENAMGFNVFKKRYGGSFHLSLMSQKPLRLATITGGSNARFLGKDGGDFVQELADGVGWLAIAKVDVKYQECIEVLLQRGVIFEHDGKYCLPAECVMLSRRTNDEKSWLSLLLNMTVAFLEPLVPVDELAKMLQPKPLKNEVLAWLAVYGEQHRHNCLKQLNDNDWKFLLYLSYHSYDDIEQIQAFYPTLQQEMIDQRYPSLRLSLEKNMPKGIRKLWMLGLIGISLRTSDMQYAAIVLCTEGRAVLQKCLSKKRQQVLDKEQKNWLVEACDIERPSPLYWEQDIWKIWVALHFLQLGVTQKKSLRIGDVKKLSKILGDAPLDKVDVLVQYMTLTDLVDKNNTSLVPASIDWKKWARQQKTMVANVLDPSAWSGWSANQVKAVLKLLAKLPSACWLDLKAVERWLDLQLPEGVKAVNWHALFVQFQQIALHHVNMKLKRIYFLPQFHAVLNEKAVKLSSPGWYGADKKAKVSGFISASGEIQLPADCKHEVLPQLAAFCKLTSIEQMITLQLDEEALQAMATNKPALKRARKLLESLQSPLPQAVAYLFDKQIHQKSVAAVAATSMVIHLHGKPAMARLQSAGFKLSQPFEGMPNIVLLDASIDAADFMKACQKKGILLDTLQAPLIWITGLANIRTWMDECHNKQWLELTYQKTRIAKEKQVYACIKGDYYDAIRIQAVQKLKQSYTFSKSMVMLEAKHILRLRELNNEEIKSLGLDEIS